MIFIQSLESADIMLNEEAEEEDDNTSIIQTIEVPSCSVRTCCSYITLGTV
jgi:hypothetical protein